jgi:inorganic triphosphatase YgiF
MNTPGSASETELKLLIPPRALRRVSAHPLLRGGSRPVTRKIYSVYFDTPDLDLSRQGVALRLRRDGARWVQTAKGGGTVQGGLHRRIELETRVAGPFPDCAAIGNEAFSGLFSSPPLCAELKPVFVTEFSRTHRIITLAPEVEVEVCVDRGEVRGGGRSEAICELELELKSGAPRHLYEIALKLLDSVPLRVENRSKAGRGYALLRGDCPMPVRANPAPLTADMPVNDAFKAIIGAALGHLQANEQGTLEGRDSEYLHQMRVALRRLRSALGMFAELLPEKQSAPLASELKWLAGRLGPARDWDVFMTETLPPVLGVFGDRNGLADFEQQCARRRRAAQRRARDALDSQRYQRLALTLAGWLVAESWLRPRDASTPAALRAPATAFAAAALERRFARVMKRGRRLKQLSPAELHRLRIAIKKLRYAVDFFAALYDSQRVNNLLARLSGLQDILGAMNDAAGVAVLTKRLGGKSGADFAEARRIVLDWVTRRAEALKYELYPAWKAFRGSGRCW